MIETEILIDDAQGFISALSQTLEDNNPHHFASALEKIDTTEVQRSPFPRVEHTAPGVCAVEVCVARTCHGEGIFTII